MFIGDQVVLITNPEANLDTYCVSKKLGIGAFDIGVAVSVLWAPRRLDERSSGPHPYTLCLNRRMMSFDYVFDKD